MGAWTFLEERLRADLAPGQRLRYVGRQRSSSPATGSHKRHRAEQEALVREALSGEAPVAGAVPADVRAGDTSA